MNKTSQIPHDAKKPMVVKPIAPSVMAASSIKLGLLNGLYNSVHLGVGTAIIAGLEQLNVVPADALPFAAGLAGGMAAAKIIKHAAQPWLYYQRINFHTQLMADLHNYGLLDPTLLEQPVGKDAQGRLVPIKSYVEAFKKEPARLFQGDYQQLAAIRDKAVQKYGIVSFDDESPSL